MLRVDNLRKRFGDVTALDRCTFSVSPGQMLGLLGPNGAGKTTAMRGVFGLMRPDGGEVSWNGRPIAQRERRGFGYMPEERGLYPKLPVRWQLAYLGRLHGMSGAAAEKAAIDSANPNDSTLPKSPYVGVQYAAIPEFQAIGTTVGQQMSAALSGKSTVDAALKASQVAAEREMKKAGYYK